MGGYAFTDTPSQARFLSARHPEIQQERLVGVDDRWDLPFAILRTEAGFDAAYPANDHATLSVLLAGSEVVRMDGRLRGRRGAPDRESVILYPGGLDRRYASNGAVRICQFYIPPTLLRAASDGEIFEEIHRFALREDRIFTPDLELRVSTDQYIRRALDKAFPPSALEMDTRATLIVLRLVQAHSDRSVAPGRARGALASDRLARVVDYIEANLEEGASLGVLADVAGVSRFHFATAFRIATGAPPHRYLLERRIERAKAMILAGRPLKEVAFGCGYSSQQHFSTAFHRATGVAPGAWRAAKR